MFDPRFQGLNEETGKMKKLNSELRDQGAIEA